MGRRLCQDGDRGAAAFIDLRLPISNSWMTMFKQRLAAFGLDRPEARAWALYDWANSAFSTTIIAAVLPVYYGQVATAGLPEGSGLTYWSYTNSVALLVVALVSPLLGATADLLGAKKRFLASFVAIGVTGTAALYFVREGDWLFASSAFIVGFIGFAGANVFYDSLLSHVAPKGMADRLSSSGYALGYLGGGLLLVINVAMILRPGAFGLQDGSLPTRLTFLTVAVWWAIFTVPIMRRVSEPKPVAAIGDPRSPIKASARRIRMTLAELGTPRYRQLMIFLIAFWMYGDGIGTIIKLATSFGEDIGLGREHLIGALVLTQFVGVPFALLFGPLTTRLGQKRAITLGLFVYVLISIAAYFIQHAWHFWALALAVATVQGGTQAVSRSLFSDLVPASRSSEFFGFFSVMNKFAGILGPLLVGAVNQLSGNSRLSILSLIVFFIGGLLVLRQVDVDAGKAAALAADAESRGG